MSRRTPRPTPPPADVAARVRELEAKAEGASLAYRARYYNEAGNLCASVGDLDAALRLWGCAIDANLQVARYRAAAATCHKAIQQAPGVVRARCTLALLAVGQGDPESAIERMEDYVRAARRAGRGDLAAHQLRVMGRATSDASIRRRAAQLLAELPHEEDGPDEAAGREGGVADADHLLGSPLEQGDRWPFLLLAAHLSPDEIARS